VQTACRRRESAPSLCRIVCKNEWGLNKNGKFPTRIVCKGGVTKNENFPRHHEFRNFGTRCQGRVTTRLPIDLRFRSENGWVCFVFEEERRASDSSSQARTKIVVRGWMPAYVDHGPSSTCMERMQIQRVKIFNFGCVHHLLLI
jgi:hypothetical protein